MGRDKLSLEVGGAPLLERVYRALDAFCREVVVVGEGGLMLPGARRVPDARSGRQGPLAGFEAGLEASEGHLVFLAAGDMPFVSEALALHLLGRVEAGFEAAVPESVGRRHPLYAAYDRAVLAEVRETLDGGERSMNALLSRLGRAEFVREGLERFGDPEVMLMNVNSPVDLARARERA